MAGVGFFTELKQLNNKQRNACLASFLGWTLDAFDFFILVFVLQNIATDFHSQLVDAAYSITLTLMGRPLGALIFGILADRFGRKPILMLVIVLYSIFELASAFAPTLFWFWCMRFVFGIAMGGEWGIGASLAMESIPTRARGAVSGILQQGYTFGYLLAAVLYWAAFDKIGWQGMFIVGACPALLAFFLAMHVEESPTFNAKRQTLGGMVAAIGRNWKMFLFIVVLMSCFNAFSHGTQDIYPTFLQKQHNFDKGTVAMLTIIGNLGAIVGGIIFGALSEKIGRRKAIAIASLLALPVIPLWAFSSGVVALAAGAFLIQVCVQGAWGVIPVHLNELSPAEIRGTLPGFTYQLGNFVVSKAAPFQIGLATTPGWNYGWALAVSAVGVVIAITVVTLLGPEKRGQDFEKAGGGFH